MRGRFWLAHHDPIGLIAPNAGLAQLNERSRDIFRQIVESYLATGEPVGSRNISRLITMPLSPASVRNVMSDLEQLGLIYAPHTSAGRLPTELGLRFFVDALMQVGDLTEPERQSIQAQLSSVGKAKSIEAALGEALTRLSGLTRAAAVVLTAKSNVRLKHIEFVRLEPEKALVVNSRFASERREAGLSIVDLAACWSGCGEADSIGLRRWGSRVVRDHRERRCRRRS